MKKEDRIKNIEDIFEEMYESITNDIGNDDELKSLWKDLYKLEDELNESIGKPERSIFDDYLNKEAETLNCERKKTFKYGYNLSNELMIDSLRE